MATRSTVPDPAVDELRRRARRRLVGAIVLAMAAAVVLPILLESDPKPLGEEVSVRIPPIDSGKFVNPLSPATAPAGKASGKAAAAQGAAAPPAPSAPAPTPPAPPTSSSTPTPVTPTPTSAPVASGKIEAPAAQGANVQSDAAKSESKSAPAAKGESGATADTASPGASLPTEAPAKAEPRTETKPEPPAKTGSQAKGSAVTEPPRAAPPKADASTRATGADTARTAGGGLAVQVGAYADAKAAAELVSTLKGQGFSGYGETVPTAHGPVRRVRVGPFTNRAEADAAVARLKAAGYERAIVVGK